MPVIPSCSDSVILPLCFHVPAWVLCPLHHPPPPRPTFRADAPLRRARADARLDQGWGIGSKMCAAVGGRGDRPDGAAVAGATIPAYTVAITCTLCIHSNTLIHSRFLTKTISAFLPHRLRVIKIPRPLRQKEQVFVGLCGSICHALGHGVGLVPDDVRAEIPAIGLQGEGHTPGDAHEVFGFEGA